MERSSTKASSREITANIPAQMVLTCWICNIEFRVFVEAAERQLLLLFRSIDKDRDGKLNKDELRAAFQKSGLAVPIRRLHGFFDEIDMNHDGYISFDEWR